MGGLLRSAPWRARPKTAARTVEASAPESPAPQGDPPSSSSDDTRGLCIADSVCGLFAEIKPPSPPG